MGWWKQGDDLLGDGPADSFRLGMRAFVAQHGKHTWQQFLDAFEPALSAGRRVRVVFENDRELTSDAARADPRFRDALAEIIRQIREEYETRCQRDPTLSEIIATAQFSLAAGAEELFTDGPARRLKGLSLQ